MFTKILKIISWKPEGLTNIKTPLDAEHEFGLLYKGQPIGELIFKEGNWSFKYSLIFQNQNEIKPLVDFPDKTKIYKSSELWPFFLSRIPGLGQPNVQKIIKEEIIDENNEAALLKRFGLKSISNPFILKSV